MATTDPTKLGKDFKTFTFDSNWNGSGADSHSAGIVSRILGDPELMKQLGLTADDIRLVKQEGYDGDSWVDAQYGISDKAREALKGMTVSRTGYEGMKDGRSQVIRDAQGNVLSIGNPYSYDPAGDMKDAALKGAALMAAGYGGGQLLGLDGAAAGGLGGLDAAMIDMGAGVGGSMAPAVEGISALGGLDAVAAAEAASGGLGGLAPAVGSSSLNPALIESMMGTPGYGASSVGAGGVTAGQTAVNAALNPYLNALGKISPELASAAGSASGGLGSLLGPAADALGPAAGVIGKLTGGGDGDTNWLKMLLPLLGGVAAYKDAKKPQLQGYTGAIKPRTATQTVEQGKYGPISRTGYAAGGITDAGVPRYLGSGHDGMEDGIAAHIDGEQPAALSGGEFVIPADVVSHLGNGNSNAGAKQLFQMMDRVRAERTGTTRQGKQIKPDRFMPV